MGTPGKAHVLFENGGNVSNLVKDQFNSVLKAFNAPKWCNIGGDNARVLQGQFGCSL